MLVVLIIWTTVIANRSGIAGHSAFKPVAWRSASATYRNALKPETPARLADYAHAKI